MKSCWQDRIRPQKIYLSQETELSLTNVEIYAVSDSQTWLFMLRHVCDTHEQHADYFWLKCPLGLSWQTHLSPLLHRYQRRITTSHLARIMYQQHNVLSGWLRVEFTEAYEVMEGWAWSTDTSADTYNSVQTSAQWQLAVMVMQWNCVCPYMAQLVIPAPVEGDTGSVLAPLRTVLRHTTGRESAEHDLTWPDLSNAEWVHVSARDASRTALTQPEP